MTKPAFKQQPQSPSGHPCALGTGIQMQQVTMDVAEWKPVTLEFETSFILMSCRSNNTLADNAHIDNQIELKVSKTADGAIWDFYNTRLGWNIAGRVGDTVAYVYAPAGTIITITGAV